MVFFPPPPRRLNPPVTPRMEELLVRALRLSAPQRYARPADMLRDLNNLVQSFPPENERPSPVTDPLRFNASNKRQRIRISSPRTIAMLGIIDPIRRLVF